jgi:putative ABC transport system permease protein
MTPAQQRAVSSAIASQPGTRHVVSRTDSDLSLAGLTHDVSITAYGGDPAWSGLALDAGRWYSSSSRAREVVANTLFLTDTGTSVGSTYTLLSGGRRTAVRIVGEVFRPGNDLQLYLSPATLRAVDPGATPQEYDVALTPGTRPGAYANALSARLGRAYYARSVSENQHELTAVLTLVAMLTILITVVAGLGVLNTAALQIRERAHDIGVFKALGMTPRQTLTMIACSVAITGLVAGIIAVPAGVLLHHNVIPAMTHAANSGYPSALISVYSVPEMIGLALAGLLIAVAGALAPASWAARSRTATALRTE